MGRRKIEIKAIKDDRNRSVTFLKRKGGLFKKAHELSVLCQVEVAVIIFGHNKKLYEFSSGDINETIGKFSYALQYGGAHEHKGPEDFMGKKDVDDEDEDEEHLSPPRQDSHTPPEHGMMPHHLQHQQQFQHMRQSTPAASPPMPNGGMPFHHRHASPQPGTLSRPHSRAQIRRTSSNLAPPQHQFSQPPQPQNNFAYMQPNPGFYPQQAHPMGKPPQGPPMVQPPPPQFQYTHPPPQSNPQMHYLQQEPQRTQSMPIFQQQPERSQPPPPAPMHHPSPPLPQPASQPQQQPPPPPQPQQTHFQSPPLPQPKPLPADKKHSIFTPIEGNGSMFSNFLGGGSSNVETLRHEPQIKTEGGTRSQSIDTAVMSRPNDTNPAPKPVPPPVSQPQRTQSTSSVPIIAPPSRTNSLQTDVKKPRLQLQIPSEHSDAGSATAGSSPKDSNTTGPTPAQTSTGASGSSVLLPPPSPSANSLLSAGATGPPNPFARPPPPANGGSYGSRSDMENGTPMSALPSRFIGDGLLPSPSSFFGPDAWGTGFGRIDSNMLPSPLPYGTTPVVANGPSFGGDEAVKRKTSDDGSDGGSQKRIKV